MPRRRNATSPAKITAAERRQQATALRLKGYTYAEIGAQMNIGRAQACKLVTAEMARTAAEAQGTTDALRALELDRLDAAQVAIWARAMNGELDAIDRVLKISARRSALLGLDRPVKVAPTTPNGDEPYEGGGLAALLKETSSQ